MQVSEKLLKKCKPAKGHVLVLKSLPANMKAYGGFQWPESGAVSAPDWKPTKECGNGLHGWLWGAGDAGLRCEDDDAKWMVLSVQVDSIVDLEGKVKFPSCLIAYMGDRETAVSIIQHYAPSGTAIMFSTVTGGDRSVIIIDFLDSDAHEIRRKIALVDGITIMPNTKYRLNDQREFEVVE